MGWLKVEFSKWWGGLGGGGPGLGSEMWEGRREGREAKGGARGVGANGDPLGHSVWARSSPKHPNTQHNQVSFPDGREGGPKPLHPKVTNSNKPIMKIGR